MSLITLIVLCVLTTGLSYYIFLAWRMRKVSQSFDYFFLGGKNIGSEFTKYSNFGLSSAWAGGIWFYAYLSYQYGLGAIFLQIPWCLSIGLLAFLFGHILKASKDETIHGYLGKLYGDNSRKIACIATSIGYFLNCGFEIYMSSLMFSIWLGSDKLVYPMLIVISVVFGTYCSIGGYMANVRTDKLQSIMGMIAICALCTLLSIKAGIIEGIVASVVMCIICLIFTFSENYKNIYLKNRYNLQELVNILSIIILIAVCIYLNTGSTVYFDVTHKPVKLFSSNMPPLSLIIGLTTFMLFFNSVDMANWQSISANSNAPSSEHKSIKLAFLRSAIYMLWFPAFCGTLLGCLTRVFPKLIDVNIFPVAMVNSLSPSLSPILSGLILGFIFLGLFSTSLTSADSYLMAAANTLSWDLFKHKEYKKIQRTINITERAELEKSFTYGIRTKLVFLALLMTTSFGALYLLIGSNLFSFQFIMYGSALSLFPSAMYGLFLQRKNLLPDQNLGKWSTMSILIGVTLGVVPYTIVSKTTNLDISTYSPLLSLLGSSLVFAIGVIFQNNKNEKQVAPFI